MRSYFLLQYVSCAAVFATVFGRNCAAVAWGLSAWVLSRV